MFVLIFNRHSFIICVSGFFKWYSQYSQMYGYSWPLKIGNNWLCRRTVWHAETNWDEFTFKSKIELVWKNCNKSYEIIWFASAVGGRSMNDYSPGKLNRKVILTEWRFGATIYVYFISLNTYFWDFIEEFQESILIYYLFKDTSGLLQKCTQLLMPFSGTIRTYYALSNGVIRFVSSVSTLFWASETAFWLNCILIQLITSILWF